MENFECRYTALFEASKPSTAAGGEDKFLQRNFRGGVHFCMEAPKKKTSFRPDIVFWAASLFLIGFLAYFVISPFDHRPITSRSNICINTLRQLDAAANQFALEHGKTNGEVINFPNDLTPFFKLNSEGKMFPCPAGGIYTFKKIGDSPTCSLGTTVTPAHVLP